MIKEKIFRKIIIESLIGFPIGITLLMIEYVSLYLIAGESLFKSEILQLQNALTLVLQLIIVGLAYYFSLISINIMSNLNQTKSISDKFLVEHPYKTILFIIIGIIITALIFILLDNKIFSENISMMNIITLMILFTVCGIYFCIKSLIESDLIKKINKKIKERNQ